MLSIWQQWHGEEICKAWFPILQALWYTFRNSLFPQRSFLHPVSIFPTCLNYCLSVHGCSKPTSSLWIYWLEQREAEYILRIGSFKATATTWMSVTLDLRFTFIALYKVSRYLDIKIIIVQLIRLTTISSYVLFILLLFTDFKSTENVWFIMK